MDTPARAVFKFFAVTLLACPLQAQQAVKPAPTQTAAKSDSGVLTDGIYRNTTFGFTYKTAFGWVDRTREMRDDSNEDSSPDSNAAKSILLLAMFERPPEASGDSVNSAVVVAAEEVASYPGLRSAEQYFGPLTELTKSKGLAVVNEPYEFRVGETQLVRGDFGKPLGNLIMHQSTLVMIEKGYVVSFTFIAGSQDEVDELVEGLSFGRKETPAARK
ncbi:MAG TPA: hypothetical protein VN950_10030 [Terriglobales bacterium]|nr:hypothetical protein [Terriglobales bacterium]